MCLSESCRYIIVGWDDWQPTRVQCMVAALTSRKAEVERHIWSHMHLDLTLVISARPNLTRLLCQMLDGRTNPERRLDTLKEYSIRISLASTHKRSLLEPLSRTDAFVALIYLVPVSSSSYIAARRISENISLCYQETST